MFRRVDRQEGVPAGIGPVFLLYLNKSFDCFLARRKARTPELGRKRPRVHQDPHDILMSADQIKLGSCCFGEKYGTRLTHGRVVQVGTLLDLRVQDVEVTKVWMGTGHDLRSSIFCTFGDSPAATRVIGRPTVRRWAQSLREPLRQRSRMRCR